MAQSMQRLRKDDLLKLLDQYADDDFVGGFVHSRS